MQKSGEVIEKEINQVGRLHLWDKVQNACFMEYILSKFVEKVVKMYMEK